MSPSHLLAGTSACDLLNFEARKVMSQNVILPRENLMRTILCFGDSNTWGDPPGGNGRFAWHERWTGILQSSLGDGFRVIEEGLCGRTTCFDDPFSPNRNGLAYLTVALETHCPLDLLIIMLGTNDL